MVNINGDTQVTFRSMVRLLIGGWSQATISAQAYLNMERAIIAQRKAGIGASATMVAAEAGLPRYYYNGNIPAKWEPMVGIMLILVEELLDGLQYQQLW